MTNTINIFETATRQRLRWQSTKGVINIEDLWLLKLEDLNTIGITLADEIAKQTQQSLIPTTDKADETLKLKFEIVKHIVETKWQEQEDRKLAAEKKARKQQLLELIAQKENEALSQKSIDELRKELEAL